LQFNDGDSGPAGDKQSEIQNVQRDIKESFEVGREDNDVMANIWYPNSIIPGFKEACMEFYWVRHIFKDVPLSIPYPLRRFAMRLKRIFSGRSL
jgi:hypothetical protein